MFKYIVCFLLLLVGLKENLLANEFLYKRGFLYSKEQPYFIPSTYNKITDTLWADKSQTIAFSDDKRCCLIGFCVDIRTPSSDRKTIANQLSQELQNSEEHFHRFEEFLCGRYVIFYMLNNGTLRLVTDATGSRPVFHNKAATLITSHAKLLAINLQKHAILKDNRIEYFDVKDPQRKTQFEGVFQLNPNKFLEVNSGRIHRFFPYEDRSTLSKEETVKQLVCMVGGAFKGLIQNQKKPILLSVTGGVDSQATLAIMLLNNIKPDACFTYINPGNAGHLRDNEIAQKLCQTFGLKHTTVRATTQPVPNQMNEAFTSNCQFAFKDLTNPVVFNLVDHFSTDQFIHVNSHIAEIWRWFNSKPPIKTEMTSAALAQARCIGLDKEITCKFNVASLLYWENRMARWLTDVWVYTDVAFDSFNPYNSRKVISMMLSVPSDFVYSQEIHTVLLEKLSSLALDVTKSEL